MSFNFLRSTTQDFVEKLNNLKYAVIVQVGCWAQNVSLYDVDLAYILVRVGQQLLMENSVRGKQTLRTRQSTQEGAMWRLSPHDQKRELLDCKTIKN